MMDKITALIEAEIAKLFHDTGYGSIRPAASH